MAVQEPVGVTLRDLEVDLVVKLLALGANPAASADVDGWAGNPVRALTALATLTTVAELIYRRGLAEGILLDDWAIDCHGTRVESSGFETECLPQVSRQCQ